MLEGKYILSKELHFKKASKEIFVTLEGMFIVCNEVQFLKIP